MSVRVVIEMTCDRCERTDGRRVDGVDVCSAERFVERRFDGWNVDPHGRALCPTCLTDAAKLARRAERSARDKARARGELPPTPRTVTIPIYRNPKEH